jgi:hypothetical protein
LRKIANSFLTVSLFISGGTFERSAKEEYSGRKDSLSNQERGPIVSAGDRSIQQFYSNLVLACLFCVVVFLRFAAYAACVVVFLSEQIRYGA